VQRPALALHALTELAGDVLVDASLLLFGVEVDVLAFAHDGARVLDGGSYGPLSFPTEARRSSSTVGSNSTASSSTPSAVARS